MTELPNLFLGRATELERLESHIHNFANATVAKGELKIVSICGSGGVGKTFLLDTALERNRAALTEALQIKLDAANEHLLAEFALLVAQMMAPTELPPPANARNDYFPATRKLLHRQLLLVGMVDAEITNNRELSEQLKTVAKAVYRMSPALTLVPKYGPAIAAAVKGIEGFEVEELVKPALDALAALRSLRDEPGIFANPLTKRRFSALRHSPFEAISEAYVSDMTAMLVGYQRKDVFRLTHRRIDGMNRLLLIVDDLEAVWRVVGTFFMESFLPRLKAAGFPVLVVLAGRDSVHDADKDFAHHFARNTAEPIRLEPFTEEEGTAYLMGFGYGEAEAREWHGRSRGLPFILRLLAENRSDEEKQSAVFYRRFYERTTRWMSREERAWLMPLCYLDKVNEGTVRALLPGEAAGRVVEWFEGESSVRDVKSRDYCVTPYVRHMLLEYNRRKVGDAGHARMEEEARLALEAG